MGINPKLLRPRSTIHPEAAAWANRVRANSGSVSGTTLNAVSKFCVAIQRANIRDRFYRLNLFCGTGLSACLVPLYRGQSLGGTQFGNTTDTNNGPFVTSDYTETLSGAGLLGGSGKYLSTGFATNTLSDGNRHLAVYETVRSGATFDRFMGSESAASVSQVFTLGYGSSATVVSFGFGAFSASLSATNSSAASFWMGVNQSAGNGIIYRNGEQDVTGSTTASAPTSSEIFIFAINRASGSPAATDFFGGRLGSYSIGLSMTAAQASAYYTAIQAFQTALGRNV